MPSGSFFCWRGNCSPLTPLTILFSCRRILVALHCATFLCCHKSFYFFYYFKKSTTYMTVGDKRKLNGDDAVQSSCLLAKRRKQRGGLMLLFFISLWMEVFTQLSWKRKCGPLSKCGCSLSQPLSHSVMISWQTDHDCLFAVSKNMDILKYLILLHTFTPPHLSLLLCSHILSSSYSGTLALLPQSSLVKWALVHHSLFLNAKVPKDCSCVYKKMKKTVWNQQFGQIK